MRRFVSTALALAAVTLGGVPPAGVSPLPSWSGLGVRPAAAQTSTEGVDARALLRENAGSPSAGRPVAREAYREFFFTRAIYSDHRGGWGRRRPRWATDYPKADYQFLTVLRRLVDIDAYEGENAVRFDDPEIRRYPFVYMLEVAAMDLTDAEVKGLRDYLEAGGFLVVDDFWGTRAIQNLAYQLSRVLPGRQIEELSLDHPVFNMVYDIEELRQVPNVGQGRRGGPTSECWGCEARVFGIFDDHGRLMVIINWNTDLGDAWEWAEDPWYPLRFSTFAYEMGVNMVVYAMSH